MLNIEHVEPNIPAAAAAAAAPVVSLILFIIKIFSYTYITQNEYFKYCNYY
jgi:hypothetical protein